MKTISRLVSFLVMGMALVFPLSELTIAGTLTGFVVNNINHDRIPGVEVSVFRADSTLAGVDTTVDNGVYLLTLDAGEYFARYSRENYADTIISDIVITPDGTTIINLTLSFLQNCDYVPGDVNGNGVCTGNDLTYVFAWYRGGPPPPYTCECFPGWIWWPAADYNGTCSFNGLDISLMIAYFKSGSLEPIPCADCPPVE